MELLKVLANGDNEEKKIDIHNKMECVNTLCVCPLR